MRKCRTQDTVVNVVEWRSLPSCRARCYAATAVADRQKETTLRSIVRRCTHAPHYPGSAVVDSSLPEWSGIGTEDFFINPGIGEAGVLDQFIGTSPFCFVV